MSHKTREPHLDDGSSEHPLPVPPVELAAYVGDRYHDDPVYSYLNAGKAIRAKIEEHLPGDWRLDRKAVLDFGCGSGRVLRHFSAEATAGVARFYGSDIHGPSVEWAQQNLCPPFNIVLSGDVPPLPFEAGSFDLIWATSVFSHLTDHWSAWLLELHRLLKPNGLLLATFMGEGYSRILTGEPMKNDEVGMNVLGYGAPWEAGGPMVLHSEWWIRAHWGRLFEFECLKPGGFLPVGDDAGQGVAVMRRRDIDLTTDDLEALEPDEPREITALQRSLAQVKSERADLNRRHDDYSNAYHDLTDEYLALKAEHDRCLAREPRPLERLDALGRRVGRRVLARSPRRVRDAVERRRRAAPSS